MDSDTSKPLPAFGFLTTLETAEHGTFGGYLVLSPLGRPLEFRCSTPVVPSRAQQILFGPTLRPYLLADVIGQTLLAEATLPVAVVLTDQVEMLPLAALRTQPIVCVQATDGMQRTEVNELRVGGYRLTLGTAAAISVEDVRETLELLSSNVDLCEPFGRVVAALTEAQLASHAASEPEHAPAAAA
ncbi:MAG TPA: hypothetical protein PKC18_07645 [Lacipirellulaceae bacterium]|nr:hypothetical protein [Lacipirellulaceae bacterium]